jgi:UrcA family protein
MPGDETVIGRDDLDGLPLTRVPSRYLIYASSNTFQENVMSHSITARYPSPRAKLALLLLGSLAGVLGLGAARAAAPDSDVPSIVVKFNGQSLATDAGVNELYHRITVAAKQVCPIASTRDLHSVWLAEQCRDQAVARAIQQIDNPRLAALHAGRSKNG